MSFLNVYNSLFTLLQDSSDLSYVDNDCFLRGFRDPLPRQTYSILLEPGSEVEQNATRGFKDQKLKVVEYGIEIFARIIMTGGGISNIITGYTDASSTVFKGLLEFMDDIKSVIRSNQTLNYDRRGSSVSAANAGTSFVLSSSARYLSISINDRTPSGYTQIDCGSSILTGSEVAATIQASLRSLGNHDDDGYNDATCTFSNSTKKFTITSQNYGPESKIVVTAGSSNDCSTLLGFDDPTELTGRNIVDLSFGPIIAFNEYYPVRYRVLPLTIKEEIQVS